MIKSFALTTVNKTTLLVTKAGDRSHPRYHMRKTVTCITYATIVLQSSVIRTLKLNSSINVRHFIR